MIKITNEKILTYKKKLQYSEGSGENKDLYKLIYNIC